MSSLIRQDTGNQLVLDAVVSTREVMPTRVTQHPVETQATITDHAQPQAIGRQLELIVSERPAVQGLTTGPERVAEVIAWLEGVRRGTALTLVEPDLPVRRDMRLTDLTWTKDLAGGIRVSLTLIQGVIATTRTVDLGPTRTSGRRTTPRADVAAGRAPTEDRGRRAGKSTSFAKGLINLGQSVLGPGE